MHDYVKNLAKVVRAAREEAHLSQAALAEQIGCDERTILNIEITGMWRLAAIFRDSGMDFIRASVIFPRFSASA